MQHHLDKAPRLADFKVAASVPDHRRALGAQWRKGQRLTRLVSQSRPLLRVGTQRIETGAQHHRPPIKADLPIARGTELLALPAATVPLLIGLRALGTLCLVAHDPRDVQRQSRRHQNARIGPPFLLLPAANPPRGQGGRPWGMTTFASSRLFEGWFRH